MNKLKTFLIVMVFVHLSTEINYSQINIGEYFNVYFEFVREVKLPENLIIGEITSIDTYEDNIVIADKFGKNAYLVDIKGKLLKKLNPDECHPGIKWFPSQVYYNKKGDIYAMLDNPPWGFIFDKKGKGVGPVDNTFLGTYWYAFTNNNQIIGYNTCNKYNINSLILMEPNGKEIKNFGVFPKEFKNLIKRRYGGGVVTDKDDNIYQLNVSSFEITKYDKTGNFIKKLKCKPHWYIGPQADYSNTTDIQQIVKDTKRVGHFSSPERLYLLDKDILAVEYWYKEKLEMILCDLEGNILNKRPINYEKQKSLFAKNGYLYFSYQAKADQKGNMPNPTIKIYKYKSNMRGK